MKAITILTITGALVAGTPVSATGTGKVKRQTEPLSTKINVGLQTNIDDYNHWVAWTNGVDPCNSNSGMFADASANPCGTRFTVPEFDQQLTFNGCGGDDLWLTENGQDRVATCYWAPGTQHCATADPTYEGQWQCVPDS